MIIKDLQEMIDQKYISVQQHPTADLYIYNYTQNTQYESLWNDLTLMCRGLILNKNFEIMARPFPKFFNWEELPNDKIPNESFEVFEKMDGSLGILYWINNEPFIATRGSFTSEQAIWASDFLQKNFKHLFHKLNYAHTYLFEIIYPENRIVVDYGEKSDLILLAIIDNLTGKDVEISQDLGFSIVKKYDGLADYQALKNFEADNFEGFVLRFKSGVRIKVKLAEYVRLHRILTNLSTLDIWEHLAENKPFDEFLANVPDEFYKWVKDTREELEQNFKQIEDECRAVYKEFDNRKSTAEYFLSQKYPMILFKMFDKKNYDAIIWKLIRPKFQKAFMNKQETI